MEVIRRVVVHLSKDHRQPQRAQFQQVGAKRVAVSEVAPSMV